MGLFGKRTKPEEPADDELGFFTESEAREFRALARQVFAEHGLEVTVHGDHAVDSDGREFGFWNVAVRCRDEKRAAWPKVVHEHVALLLASMDAPDPFEGLSAEAAADQAVARLYDVDALPDLTIFPHREFAPGIVEVIALDLPQTVSVFSHENASALGGAEHLRTRGVENLAALPIQRVEEVRGPDDASFTLLLGESVYTGSQALLLPGLAERASGSRPGEHGWLMSVPNRHQVTWHAIHDATVIGALQGMAGFTAAGYSDGVSPVSPHVFWWDGTTYVQLTRLDDEGRLTIHVGPEFLAVLESVGAAPD